MGQEWTKYAVGWGVAPVRSEELTSGVGAFCEGNWERLVVWLVGWPMFDEVLCRGHILWKWKVILSFPSDKGLMWGRKLVKKDD